MRTLSEHAGFPLGALLITLLLGFGQGFGYYSRTTGSFLSGLTRVS